MKPRHLSAVLCASLALLTAAALCAQDDEEERIARREEALAELLTGARLTGWFSDDTRPDAAPAKDSYTLARVEKADDGKWLFESVIGESGVKVSLYLPLEWAGDTPVLTLDRFAVPQMGTFDARVLFHGTSYAGTWRGEGHGGQMMGRVERPAPAGTAAK